MRKPELKTVRQTFPQLKSGKRLKKQLVAGMVAAATALSMLVGTATGNPLDLAAGTPEPPAIVEILLPEPENGTVEEGENEVLTEEKKRGIRARLRAWFLRMPLSGRLLICLPLWVAGAILVNAAGALSVPAAQPILWALGKLLLNTAVLTGLFCTTVKAVSPEVPIRKILNKKTISGTVLTAAALETGAAVLMVCREDGARLVTLLRCIFMLTAMIAVILTRVWNKKKQEADKG